jgi:hypothetical protein
MKQSDQGLLFVEIREPSATRRDVLMSTKDVLDALKRYEEYKAVKAEKQKALEQLKKTVDDLLVLNRKLRSRMPKAPVKIPELTLRARPQSRDAREREERIITGPAPSVARPKSKLDILQEELEKIESRLGALE